MHYCNNITVTADYLYFDHYTLKLYVDIQTVTSQYFRHLRINDIKWQLSQAPLQLT